MKKIHVGFLLSYDYNKLKTAIINGENKVEIVSDDIFSYYDLLTFLIDTDKLKYDFNELFKIITNKLIEHNNKKPNR